MRQSAELETEQIQVQGCEMFRRRHKHEKSSGQTVIGTTTSHKAKRDETLPRVVTLEYADAMCAPEHYASTLRTRALQFSDQQSDVEVSYTST